jgi:hypothetical protein
MGEVRGRMRGGILISLLRKIKNKLLTVTNPACYTAMAGTGSVVPARKICQRCCLAPAV